MDYGALVMGNMSKGAKNIYKGIAYRALRIVCGAMHGTALEALEAETGEPPLAVLRLKQQIKYSIKTINSTHNPTKTCYAENWQNHSELNQIHVT